MRISTKGRYALTIMRNLAMHYDEERFIPLNEISEKENISLKYLEKIMISLKKANFFEVAKGKVGGYKLNRKPEEYTIGEIIRAADEELNVASCVTEECPNQSNCKTYSLWKGLSNEINNFLDSKNLGEYI